MPDFLDEFLLKRNDWPIIFVANTSGSMAGLRNGENHALNQILSSKVIAKLGYTSMLDYYLVVYEN